MSTDLVAVLSEGTFSEQVLEFAGFLSRSLPEGERAAFVESFQASAQEADEDESKCAAVLSRVVDEVKGVGEGSERELEGAFNLLTALILYAWEKDEEKRAEVLAKLSAAVSKEQSGSGFDRAGAKYRILSNIFNALPASSSARLTVFESLLDVAAAHDELEYLSDAFSAIPAWLSSWDVPSERKSALLSSVASKLAAADNHERAYEFLLIHLRFLDSSSPEAAQTAEQVIASALKLPKVWEFEQLLQIQAVQALKGKPIFELLTIFVGGSAEEYKKWEGANGGEVSRLSLDPAQLDRKMRLLDLASLCSRSVSTEVPYAEIASVLRVPESEVEAWVIDVIRAGLVSGKLSQVNSSFRVYRSTYRTFGAEQWQLLEQRLVQWQSSIDRILATITEARAGGEPAAVAAV
ncbi:hypothetical protein FA09DRAFT_321899 [Tilletiopsis washingtonensis]|uniref:Eukaryotic translation initiation factor 3 subunit M n=1 Tax=Tilletiopsis washingtonensis TaxID=58919 RepID=A0A316Z342_9BASI|nr:hypothetical protein FA09DRAFT_321899 [Tilletiopsis washingtonensis]PWN95806.1 hypothetical protein FA09DRAFT_321899 [Tilletiopsis washingtonensis]